VGRLGVEGEGIGWEGRGWGGIGWDGMGEWEVECLGVFVEDGEGFGKRWDGLEGVYDMWLIVAYMILPREN